MLSMLIRAATVVHSISTHAYHAFPCYLHHQVKHQSMDKHGKDEDSMEFPWIPCFSPCFFYQGDGAVGLVPLYTGGSGGIPYYKVVGGQTFFGFVKRCLVYPWVCYLVHNRYIFGIWLGEC